MDIESWNTFNHWLNHERQDRRVMTWLEFKYVGDKVSDLFVYSDMTSVIDHFSWTFEGEKVVQFVKQCSFGVNTDIQFSYLPNQQLDTLSFYSFYAEVSNPTKDQWLSKFRMAYNSKGELVGYRQEH
jgi:hypothetical protein